MRVVELSPRRGLTGQAASAQTADTLASDTGQAAGSTGNLGFVVADFPTETSERLSGRGYIVHTASDDRGAGAAAAGWRTGDRSVTLPRLPDSPTPRGRRAPPRSPEAPGISCRPAARGRLTEFRRDTPAPSPEGARPPAGPPRNPRSATRSPSPSDSGTARPAMPSRGSEPWPESPEAATAIPSRGHGSRAAIRSASVILWNRAAPPPARGLASNCPARRSAGSGQRLGESLSDRSEAILRDPAYSASVRNQCL